MTNEKDILNKALASIREEQTPELPKDVVAETLAQLAQTQSASGTEGSSPPGQSHVRRTGHLLGPIVRFTAAAAVFLLIGYAVGRMTGPAPLDVDQLHNTLLPALAAALEPTLREAVVDDVDQRYQLALAGAYVRLRDELTEQQRSDMNRYAAQTLAASNAVTNQLLGELVQTIKADQTNELRSVAAALLQFERNRLEDRETLTTEFLALAKQTEETRNELVQLVVNRPPAQRRPDEQETTEEQRID